MKQQPNLICIVMIQIGTDFQGWPIKAYTVEEILRQIGAEETDSVFIIKKDNPILKAYPRLLEDDGMAYGVNPQYVTEVDTETYDQNIIGIEYVEDKDSELGYKENPTLKEIKVFNVFRDVPENRLEDDE